MIYVIKYSNPNNAIYSGTYTFETESRSEYNEFLKKAREYPGSYHIVSEEKIRQTKKHK